MEGNKSKKTMKGKITGIIVFIDQVIVGFLFLGVGPIAWKFASYEPY